MTKQKDETNETLESYKAKAKLQSTKVHYRYAIVLAIFASLAIGTVAGYFMSIEVIGNAQSRVVNSITLKAEQ